MCYNINTVKRKFLWRQNAAGDGKYEEKAK